MSVSPCPTQTTCSLAVWISTPPLFLFPINAKFLQPPKEDLSEVTEPYYLLFTTRTSWSSLHVLSFIK